MRKALAGVLVVGLLFAVWGWAVECPPSKYAVTFRYVPLPGENVVSVSLRGSFNNWGEWPMTRQPDGTWAITVCLDAGTHQYKFYINGQWPRDMATARAGGPVDPAAHGYVDDGFGGRNAIRRVGTGFGGEWEFKYRLFPTPVLVDYNRLTLRATLAGLEAFEFKSLTKFKWGGVFEEQGFEVEGLFAGQFPLKAGMYFDPQAIKYKHTFVELKSLLGGLDLTAKAEHWAEGYLPENRCPVPVTFRYYPRDEEPPVTSVHVAGEFNGWNPTATPMVKKDGYWEVTVHLTPGPIKYKYVINGNWVPDMSNWYGSPADPDAEYYVHDGFGGWNAVRNIRSTCRAEQVQVTFRYWPREGQIVYGINVAGEFDGWNPTDPATEMSLQPDGSWAVTITLAPGYYQYKYVINDNWGTGWVPYMCWFVDGPADPDATGCVDWGNAVRAVGDPMPAYLRYTLEAKVGNIEATLRFEDCCCGTMFKDLSFKLKNVALCCGLTFDAGLYFTKHGFDHLWVSTSNFLPLCCGISVGFDLRFGVDYKKLSPKVSWEGITGCFTVYGDARIAPPLIWQGLEFYGFKLRCDFGTCSWLEVLTALNVAKIEEIFQADIFFGNEYQMVKFGFCGPACCGGTYSLVVTTFFQPSGGLFGIARIWLDMELPILPNVVLLANVSPTIPEMYFGWRLKF